MKKTTHITLLPIVALLLLPGCTADEQAPATDARPPRAVSLWAYTPQPLTRADSALLAVDALPGGSSIGVYAYYHDNSTWTDGARPDFMFNQQATNSASGAPYTYAPLKYWPNEEADKLSFIAYYPYVDAGTRYGITPLLTPTGTGLPTFTFTVSDDVKQQADFMVSHLKPNLPQTRDTDDDPALPMNDLTVSDRVRFYFEHMTSKVELHVVVDDAIRHDLAYFTLHSLALTHIYKDGLLTPHYDAATAATTFTWSGHTTTTDYACKTTEAYLLLPQTLRDDAQLTIGYDLVFKSEGTTYTYDGSGNAVATDTYAYSGLSASVQLNTLLATGTDDPITAWLPNHHYVYTIRLGANRIDFTGQVAPWGDYNWTILN